MTSISRFFTTSQGIVIDHWLLLASLNANLFLMLTYDFVLNKNQQDFVSMQSFVYAIRKISDFFSQVDSKWLYAQMRMQTKSRRLPTFEHFSDIPTKVKNLRIYQMMVNTYIID